MKTGVLKTSASLVCVLLAFSQSTADAKTRTEEALIFVVESTMEKMDRRVAAAKEITDQRALKRLLETYWEDRLLGKALLAGIDDDAILVEIANGSIPRWSEFRRLAAGRITTTAWLGEFVMGGSLATPGITEAIARIDDQSVLERISRDHQNANIRMYARESIERILLKTVDGDEGRLAMIKKPGPHLVRMQAINEIISEIVLEEIALDNSLGDGLQERAVDRIQDEEKLMGIALSGAHDRVRSTAVAKLKEPEHLFEVARSATMLQGGVRAARVLNDVNYTRVLVKVALAPEVRIDVLNRIEDQSLIQETALTDSDHQVRAKAISLVQNDEFRAERAFNADTSWERLVAVLGLQETRILRDIAQRVDQEGGFAELKLALFELGDGSVYIDKLFVWRDYLGGRVGARVKGVSYTVEIKSAQSESKTLARFATEFPDQILFLDEKPTSKLFYGRIIETQELVELLSRFVMKVVENERIDDCGLAARSEYLRGACVMVSVNDYVRRRGLDDSAEVVRYAAISVLEDDELHLEAALTDTSLSNRLLAVQRIKSQSTLDRVYEQSPDKVVRQKIREQKELLQE